MKQLVLTAGILGLCHLSELFTKDIYLVNQTFKASFLLIFLTVYIDMCSTTKREFEYQNICTFQKTAVAGQNLLIPGSAGARKVFACFVVVFFIEELCTHQFPRSSLSTKVLLRSSIAAEADPKGSKRREFFDLDVLGEPLLGESPVHSRLPHPVQRVAEVVGVKPRVRPRVHIAIHVALSQLKVRIANSFRHRFPL